jgi:Permuted papain-like amidase enzyme, YaeF/YiiX, C92 family
MTEPRSQFAEDVALLRAIFEKLDEVERNSAALRTQVLEHARGYFTPQEDDLARELILCYRDCRATLYDVMDRYMDYVDFDDDIERLRAFIVGFAAALQLYEKALKIIRYFGSVPLLKRKLNEPDAKFGIERGFYDEVFGAFSSPHSYLLFVRAKGYWRRHRRAIHRLEAEDSLCAWLGAQIRIMRHQVRTTFRQIAFTRLRHDWRWLLQGGLAPFRRARYATQALLFSSLARLQMPGYHPGISAPELTKLRSLLQPGDVLLVRADGKLTSSLLPGFWTHVAIYLGNRRLLEPLEISSHPYVALHWNSIPEGNDSVCVIEARPPAVMISTIERCLYADHVLAVRPKVSREDLRSSLCEAFGHMKKRYDFKFDFRATSRIVCTELVYRSFDGKGAIKIPLVRLLGRFTLTCDQLADYALHVGAHGQAAFEPVACFLKRSGSTAHWVPHEEIVRAASEIRSVR